MTYVEFQKWAQHRINYDLKYNSEGDFYSFSFIANSFIVKNEDLAYLKPYYPWKLNLLNEIKSEEIKNILNEKKLIEQKEEINELRLKIQKLEQELKK